MGFGIYFERPTKYTPIPRHTSRIPVARGSTQAPNIAERGIIISISSIGVNRESPSIRNIVPITKCFIHLHRVHESYKVYICRIRSRSGYK